MGFINNSTEITKAEFGQAWRDTEHGMIHATVRLGNGDFVLDNSREARELAGAVLAALQALQRLEADPELTAVSRADLGPVDAGQAAAAPTPGWASSITGERLLSPVTDDDGQAAE